MKQLLLLFSVTILLSCGTAEILMPGRADSVPDEYGDIMVSTDNLFLFADLSGNGRFVTKNGDEASEMVSLESLLDRDATEQITFESLIVKQIPFLDNRNDKKVMFSKAWHDRYDTDSLTVVKTFLIEVTDSLGRTVQKNVATMIPYVDYIYRHGSESISFLEKSVYCGIILFSDLQGRLVAIYTYGNGPIGDAIPISFEEADTYADKMYISVPSAVRTKSEDETIKELDASYCIAELPLKLEDPKDPGEGHDDNGHETGDDRLTDGSGGGGGHSIEPVRYKISLSAATGGCVAGSGEYVKNTLVVCQAHPDNGFSFSRWVGDLGGKTHHVSFQICSDIEATAYFFNILTPAKLPCWDKERGLANPLVEMKLAPTSTWNKNYIGATFGMTRRDKYGNRKPHSGIDLYAKPGTPVYAICDGAISKTDKYVTEQPMRIGTDTYPPGYNGDTDGAGNRFTLEGRVQEEIVKFSYWHLDAGNPIAINPRTGQPFKPGDKVYRGELLAYTGCTGNAYLVPFPHLHLTVIKNGTIVNPEDYLNGKVSHSSDKGVISSTEITGIKCDEEDKELVADYAF